MRRTSLLVLAAVSLCAAMSVCVAAQKFSDFIRVSGDQLTEHGKPFRFVSFNIPNLHLVEDVMTFENDNAWRWPDRFEIADALEAVRQQGGQVVRTYVLSVVRTNDAPGLPRHVFGPGKFNEEGFKALDLVMQVAHEKGIRVIFPFVDNWSWWGGITEYAGFRGKPKEAFWTDPEVIADFKQTIRFLVTRTNTLTGVAYKDDKALLCWETGNELTSPPEWTQEIAAYIKSLDKNHLVMDGYHTTKLRDVSLTIPNIDVVTTHHYPGGKESFAELVRENWAKAKGKRPYVVGEFGFVETSSIAATIAAVKETGTAGALLWSLRYRSRDGGFYWHYEPAGGNFFKAYHWPGFPSGASYDEIGLMDLMQREAFAIRGLRVPAMKAPGTPTLLGVTDIGAIAWQGSAGATTYLVERADSVKGPWTVAGQDIDETSAQYQPGFADEKAMPGRWYYRVRAVNAAGSSKPSAVRGPIEAHHRVLVDEFRDFSRIRVQQGDLQIKTKDCRSTKEDAHRLAGKQGSAIAYCLDAPVRSVKLYAFFPKELGEYRLLVSQDGAGYVPITARREVYFGGNGDYGYWKPALFRADAVPPGYRWLKIEFPNESQASRVEIRYGE